MPQEYCEDIGKEGEEEEEDTTSSWVKADNIWKNQPNDQYMKLQKAFTLAVFKTWITHACALDPLTQFLFLYCNVSLIEYREKVVDWQNRKKMCGKKNLNSKNFSHEISFPYVLVNNVWAKVIFAHEC